jgi:hypothetical protein
MKLLINYITKSLIWILVVLGGFEAILQITLTHTPEIYYEKDWGIVPVPGSVRLSGTEGYGFTHYFTHGEIATPFDDGAVSIVVLGDSSTEALQVSDNEKFVSLTEQILRAKGLVANLHNLGESGNSIPEYIYFAPLIKQYYDPEIVVIQLDMSDGEDAYNPEHLDYFTTNGNGDLELHHKDGPTSYNRIFNKFRIVLPLMGRYRFAKILQNIKAKSNNDGQLQGAGTYEDRIRMDDQLRLLQEAYAGIKVIILLLPNTPSVEGNNITFIDPNYQTLLARAEAIDGFHIIDPKPEFDRLLKRGFLPRGFMNSMPGEGHLNRFGHLIIGELLSEKIMEIAQ